MSDGMDIGLGVATGGIYNLNKALLGGMFGGRGGAPNFDDLIKQRQDQIDSFANQLEMARNNVLSNYQNLQANTMKAFMPQYEANLAGRGLNVAGGAFASGVGRQAAGLQSNYDMLNANMTENNLNTIGQMKSQLFGQTMSLKTFPAMQNYQNRVGMQQAFGGVLGTAAGSFLNPLGAMGGLSMGRNLFGSPGQNDPMQGLGAGNWFKMGQREAPEEYSIFKGY